MKNLLLFWTGDFKGLDSGSGDVLEPKVWAEIGQQTAKTGDTIPSVYGARVPNIANDWSLFSTDNYSFFALYIAPVLLRGRFAHRKYYDHFIELVRLLHLCLQFDLPASEVETLHNGFVDWVKDYEKYVALSLF